MCLSPVLAGDGIPSSHRLNIFVHNVVDISHTVFFHQKPGNVYNRLATPFHAHESTTNQRRPKPAEQWKHETPAGCAGAAVALKIWSKRNGEWQKKKKLDPSAECIVYHVEGMQRQLHLEANVAKRWKGKTNFVCLGNELERMDNRPYGRQQQSKGQTTETRAWIETARARGRKKSSLVYTSIRLRKHACMNMFCSFIWRCLCSVISFIHSEVHLSTTGMDRKMICCALLSSMKNEKMCDRFVSALDESIVRTENLIFVFFSAGWIGCASA